MRGHPHIAQHFKIEFFEARFFASAPTPFMPTSKPDSKLRSMGCHTFGSTCQLSVAFGSLLVCVSLGLGLNLG